MGCLQGHSSPILQPPTASRQEPQRHAGMVSHSRALHLWQTPKQLDFISIASQSEQRVPAIPSSPLLMVRPIHSTHMAPCLQTTDITRGFCSLPRLPKPPRRVLDAPPSKHSAQDPALKRNLLVPARWTGAKETNPLQAQVRVGQSDKKYMFEKPPTGY